MKLNYLLLLTGIIFSLQQTVFGAENSCSEFEGDFIDDYGYRIIIDDEGYIRSNLQIAFSQATVPVRFPRKLRFDPFDEICRARGYVRHLGCNWSVTLDLKASGEYVFARMYSPTTVSNLCISLGTTVHEFVFYEFE